MILFNFKKKKREEDKKRKKRKNLNKWHSQVIFLYFMMGVLYLGSECWCFSYSFD